MYNKILFWYGCKFQPLWTAEELIQLLNLSRQVSKKYVYFTKNINLFGQLSLFYY